MKKNLKLKILFLASLLIGDQSSQAQSIFELKQQTNQQNQAELKQFNQDKNPLFPLKNRTFLQEEVKLGKEKEELFKKEKSEDFQKGESEEEELSYIERNFNSRIKKTKTPIKQFGYDFFRGYSKLPTAIPVGKDYVLGPGDEILIYVIGSTPSGSPGVLKLAVDREGKIFIPNVGVFYVWGKTRRHWE